MAKLQNPVLWVHGDNLSPNNPIFAAYPAAPGLFVWDDALLTEWNVTLKRIAFIYESLLELPVTIRRGDLVAQLAAFAREHEADGVVTVESPSPRFVGACLKLNKTLPVKVLREQRFLDFEGELDLKRFSRYWQTAQHYAFGKR